MAMASTILAAPALAKSGPLWYSRTHVEPHCRRGAIAAQGSDRDDGLAIAFGDRHRPLLGAPVQARNRLPAVWRADYGWAAVGPGVDSLHRASVFSNAA